MNIKQELLDALKVFKYDPEVQKTFLVILDVRFDRNAETRVQIDKFLSAKQIKSSFLDALDSDCLDELKRLNLMNMQARLAFLEKDKKPETVVTSYMRLIIKEAARPEFCLSSVELEQAEEKMLSYLTDEALLSEDLTDFEEIDKQDFRLILQTWLLSPEYLKHPEKLKELLECLSVTSINF